MSENPENEVTKLPAWKRRQDSLRSADSDHLGYDFHKTIMNVSLLALGATLTLGETAFADRIPDAGLESVIEAAEECPGECIFIEVDA